MNDAYISREEVLNLIDTAFESGAFDGRYAYENLIDAVQNLIHPLETDLISRQAVIDRINRLIEVEKKQGTDGWGYGQERVNAYEAMLHMVESEYLHPSVKPEKCGDCISRQAVLDLFAEKCDAVRPYHEVWQAVKDLPTVKPERKCGKWINVDGTTNSADCSCCGNRGRAWMNYCYMCGSKMEVQDDEGTTD